MAEKSKIFHIGGKKLNNIELLSENYGYYHLPMDESLTQKLSDLAAIPVENPNNSGNIFLFSFEAMDNLTNFDLTKFPSYQIFYEGYATLTPEQERILKLKGAKKVNLIDGGSEFIAFINENYTGSWGTSIDNSMVEISKNFAGTVTKKGAAYLSLAGDFGTDYQQVLLWKNRWVPTGKIRIHVESAAQGDDIDYFFRAYYIQAGVAKTWDFTKSDIEANKVFRDIGFPDFAINIAVMAKGKGQIELGDVHLRSYLEPDNFLAMGGKRLLDKDHRDQELAYYFNAGDLKPPLNVYFSGYRAAENYEGRWMMGSMGAPFMLIQDPRIVGGSFYRGDNLEKQLIEAIQGCLDQLGFTKDDLILSGISMGTYAAFYYGAVLEPHAIIVGKPLANLGGLAFNSRIFDPYNGDLTLDTIIDLTGELTKDTAKRLDKEFWERFFAADFSKTTFNIVHMLQDTDLPFKKIFNYLKEKYPKTKVLHKGLEGRHNDDGLGIVLWFTKQCKALLQTDFDRKYFQDDDQKTDFFDLLEVDDD
ncbi:hypothetical protein WOSG25_080080 [Weissella oryzae SG25]|uniref:Accessory Sec system protein Asp2 n=1 Tax=Weissella oryzae (strain DSM 25784 / JCM 18191 / LMG 30913 / SG25) TaxID=1329250 RepID=A0A069D1E3_WEIOS|nr:accessory Sec system protein Asp2 [Weissella oryzae]GAK31176.1 hypothetical protein WOSG25_080080 [Weissella oryzae SG25]